MMKTALRTCTLLLLAALVAVLPLAVQAAEPKPGASRPNVVVFITDDMRIFDQTCAIELKRKFGEGGYGEK